MFFNFAKRHHFQILLLYVFLIHLAFGLFGYCGLTAGVFEIIFFC